MENSRVKLILLPLLLAVFACGPSVSLFGGSGSGAGEATATQTPTTEAITPPPPTATATPLPDLESTPTAGPALEWPDGSYTVTHDEGSMVCEGGINQGIPAGDETVVTLAWQDPGQSLQLSGLEGQTMQFSLDDSGAGGFSMVSEGVYGGVPMNFTLYFLYGFHWIEGSIDSEFEGCTVQRTFTATPN